MTYTKQCLFILILFVVSSAQAALPPQLDAPLDNLTIYSSAAITMGASSVVGGNIQVEAAATIGASSKVGGYLVIGAAATLDANVAVGGYIEARDAGTIGANSTVGGDFTTGDAATLGATTLANNIMVGGNLTAGAAILVGVSSKITGNLKSGASASAGLAASVNVGGNATAGTALSIGATVLVGGNVQAGTGAVALGEYTIVRGDATAGTTVTVPVTAAVLGVITNGEIVNFPASTKDDIDDQSPQLLALQAELAAMPTNKEKLPTAMTVSKTLKKGIYNTTALSTTAGITITLDGENEEGHWLINIDTFIAFGANTIIELLNVTPNSTITWNAGGYISAGADVQMVGSFFAGSYILTGASTSLKGVGDACGGLFTTTGAVTFGASNLIGSLGCSNEPATQIDHYEIIHDGQGLTCEAETVTIKACTNENCSDLSTESVTLDFLADDVVVNSATFIGSTEVVFNHRVAETLTFSLADASITASNDFVCNDASIDSCDMVFSDALFRFLYGDNNESISHQTAGKVFEKTLKLQAVKSNNGVCEGLFTGNVNVSIAQENVTPDLAFNAGLAFQTRGVNIAKHPEFTDDITLDFGSDSIAIIPTPNYLDSGEIRLNAKYTNVDINITIEGSSNNFWVKPDRFEIMATNANGALNGNSASSTTKHKAGENFNFTVSALNAADDLTQNYRQVEGQLQLIVSRVAPVTIGAVDGNFTYAAGQSITATTQAVTLTSFIDGVKGQSKFNGAQYDEVGVINIDVQAIDYGGLGNENGLVEAVDINVGRFTPAYFKQSIKQEHKGDFNAYPYPDKIGVCAFSDWAYTGQRTADDKGTIAYSLEPKITITAFNANDNITQNYTLGEPEGFMKLSVNGVDIALPTHDETQQIVDKIADNPVAINAVMQTGSLSAGLDAGEWFYTFSSNDHFSYNHDDTSLLPPFAAQIPFVTKQITDTDDITLLIDSSTDEVAAAAIEKFVTKGVKIRFARMVLENAYGSENAQLRAQLTIEVYDGTSFNVHTDESCLTALIGEKKTGIKYSGNMNLWDYRLIDIDSDVIAVNDTEASVSGVFSSGMQNQFFFSKPEKQGALEWEYEVPSWLKFNWNAIDADEDGNFYDDNPSAVLSFGLFRGNDRIISWREVFNQ